MIVFVGESNSKSIRSFCAEHGWGIIYVTRQPKKDEKLWAFDNGGYLDWVNGREFGRDRYLRALETAMNHSHPPYMAVVPDLVGRGQESLDFSMRWLEELPAGWPWYLALQDGMGVWEVGQVTHRFEGLFLGGTDAFKREADDWKCVAAIAGLRFHYARAGTERKIKHAIRIKADSLDSSFPLWTFGRMRRMEYLVNDWVGREPLLFQEYRARLARED